VRKLFFVIFLKFEGSIPIIVIDGNSKHNVFVVHLGNLSFHYRAEKGIAIIAALQFNKARYTTLFLPLIACGGWSLPCYIDTGNKPKVCMFPCHETFDF